MKKFLFSYKLLFLSLFLLAFLSPLMAQTPEELTGIWESEDRIIFFGKDNEISIILKVFDRWYFDRAAQSEKFEEKSSRDRNSATSKNPVILSCNFEKIENTEECYEITLYDGKDIISRIPLCLLNDKIFLDFLIKIPESTRFLTFQDDKNGGEEIDENSIYGYWQGINAKNNIRISPQKEKQNIYSYFILPQAIYQLRFWQTDMEYSSEGKASFTDGENVFTVSKHIFTGGNNFSCTSGRSTRIRNVNKFQKLPFEAVFSEKNNVLAIGKGNFSRAGEASKERLLQIVKEANSRKKPLPPSPFPEENIDFHWDLIDALEKNNPQIQAVRQRQKDFGIRGKDIGK